MMTGRQQERARLADQRRSTGWPEHLGCAGDGRGKYAEAARILANQQKEKARGMAYARDWREQNATRPATDRFPFRNHRTVQEIDRG